MKKTNDSASGNCAKLISTNVELFNKIPNEDNERSGNFRMKTLRFLFNRHLLEGVIIYGLSHYKPRRLFKGESDSKHWYANVILNEQNRNESFIAIEERRDEIWILQKLIPLKNIASIKTDLVPIDETRFYLFITVSDLENIKTPISINFKRRLPCN